MRRAAAAAVVRAPPRDRRSGADRRRTGRFRARYAETGWRENVVCDGVAEAVAALAAAGAVLHVCTSKPQPYAERIVAHFGLAPHFASVYGADLAGTLDDKAKLVAHLLARERIDPAACAMIGDRRHDVHAAHANGVRAVGVLWGYGLRAELEQAGADVIVETPHALASALASLADAGVRPR